jgi:energy-coupling factor transporter ATP-binding protein EcfA2
MTSTFSSDAELQGRLQSALRLQADAFAEIARSKSNQDLHTGLKSSGEVAPRRSRSARVAEQIKRDEDLAKKLSMEDLAMVRGRRVDISQAAPRRPYDERPDISQNAPRSFDEGEPVSSEIPPRPPPKEWPGRGRTGFHDIFAEQESMPEAYVGPSFAERAMPPPSYHELPNPPHSVPDEKSYGTRDSDTETPQQNINNSANSSQAEHREPLPGAGSTNYDRFSKLLDDTFDEPPPLLPERPAAPAFNQSEHRPNRDSLDPRRLSGTSHRSGGASPRESHATCDQCQRKQDWVSFCPVCNFNYCQAHWDSQPLHREMLTVNGVPHEKTNPDLAKRITSVIEPSINDAEQNQLHVADDDTTWFGVLPDQTGELMFHDFGRYEEFLTQSMFAPKSAQFPSLISFVGPTGAGKSTIVKALVKLFVSGSEHLKQQAPVVGMTQHQAVPTSGEVHLYWDPSSLLTNRPLMYADCEGLGGGSREPMAARATAIRDKKTLTKERKEKGRMRSGSDSSAPSESYGQHSKHISIRDLGFRHGSASYSSMSPRNTPGIQRSSWIEYQESVAGAFHAPYSPPVETPDSQDGWTPGSGKVFRGITRRILWANEKEKRSRQFIVENLYPRLLYTFSDIVVLVMRNAKSVLPLLLMQPTEKT